MLVSELEGWQGNYLESPTNPVQDMEVQNTGINPLNLSYLKVHFSFLWLNISGFLTDRWKKKLLLGLTLWISSLFTRIEKVEI